MEYRDIDTLFETSDFWLACLLRSKGLKLWGLQPVDADRVNFVFEGHPSPALLADYAAGTAQVNASDFARASRELKRKLHERRGVGRGR